MIRDRRDPTRVPEWWSRAVACVSCVLWVRALLDRSLGPPGANVPALLGPPGANVPACVCVCVCVCVL